VQNSAPVKADVQALRKGEAVALCYFLYTALVASLQRLSWAAILISWSIPAVIYTLGAIERRYSRRWSSMLRDWLTLALILAAYWQLDWFARPFTSRWNDLFIGYDRALLHRLGAHSAVEIFGGAIPQALEAVYLLLYTIPPVCLAVIYWYGARNRADRFLFTLLLGTFTAYALLPYFPTTSPRIAFPDEDLPRYAGIFRYWNIWLLDHYDISTGIFPSGHVAVAFSCGFGLLRTIPRKPRWWGAIFCAAALVFLATIYGRYHYAADGLASVGISTTAWVVSGVIDRDD
jgi:hypothetical protein